MARKCRKCGKLIPTLFVVEGKTHNLCNRKFCLDCSPFKSGNTSFIDPVNRVSRKYSSYSEKQKDTIKLSLYFRALKLRQELYAKFGNQCAFCGYSRCARALSFHHIDPTKKLFGLSLNNLWSKPKEEIYDEVSKCILVCLNCHAEMEDAIARVTSIIYQVNQKYGTKF